MTVLALGASHRTVDVAALNRFAQALAGFRTDFQDAGQVRPTLPVREISFLSTCNRVEVYAVAEEGREDEVVLGIRDRVFASAADYTDALYELRGASAVHHLCRVAAGLDSMVVGEPQIAGQVAKAFQAGIRFDGRGDVLGSVAALARSASRRVREETELGRHSVSMASVALDLVETELGTLEGLNGIVVGAGKIGSLVSRLMKHTGLSGLTVLNRSPERLRSLADRLGCQTAPLEMMPGLLPRADVVITATDSARPILDVAMVTASLNGRTRSGPLCIVDLALPADVHPDVADLDGVRLFDLNDVQERLEHHVDLRMQAVGPAEVVVAEVVETHAPSVERADVEGLIGELRQDAERIRSATVDRWLERRNGSGAPDREEIDRLTRTIVNRLFHEPMVRLRTAPLPYE
jgi:glutamyl-tRNA reductase